MQQKVNLYPAAGVPGQEVNVHTAVYTPFNYISDGTAAAGSFVFPKANTSQNGSVAYPMASSKGTGAVLGLVERTFSGTLSYDESGSAVYPAGHAVTIAVRGDYYASATGAATVGQAVLCDPSTGAVTYGTAGAANDTGWTVKTAASAEGDLIIITNRGLSVAAAASDNVP
jgi:hypothetical protein